LISFFFFSKPALAWALGVSRSELSLFMKRKRLTPGELLYGTGWFSHSCFWLDYLKQVISMSWRGWNFPDDFLVIGLSVRQRSSAVVTLYDVLF
jgi:hypothetical protein